jgi:hypothetical protein
VLAKTLVVCEDKCFVFLDWAAYSPSELVTPEGGSRSYIEVVRGVENVITQKFIDSRF